MRVHHLEVWLTWFRLSAWGPRTCVSKKLLIRADADGLCLPHASYAWAVSVLITHIFSKQETRLCLFPEERVSFIVFCFSSLALIVFWHLKKWMSSGTGLLRGWALCAQRGWERPLPRLHYSTFRATVPDGSSESTWGSRILNLNHQMHQWV